MVSGFGVVERGEAFAVLMLVFSCGFVKLFNAQRGIFSLNFAIQGWASIIAVESCSTFTSHDGYHSSMFSVLLCTVEIDAGDSPLLDFFFSPQPKRRVSNSTYTPLKVLKSSGPVRRCQKKKNAYPGCSNKTPEMEEGKGNEQDRRRLMAGSGATFRGIRSSPI